MNTQIGHVKVDNETSLGTAIIIWASVYALAEKLMDRETKNAVAKEFYKRRRDLWEGISRPSARKSSRLQIAHASPV